MKQIDPNLLATEETLHNNNTAAELARHGNVLNGLLSDIPGVPVAAPVPTYDYTKTARYPFINYSWKFSLNPIGPVTAPLTAAKGGIPMLNTSVSNLTLGPLAITKDGLLWFQNQLGPRITAMLKGSGQSPNTANAVYPREIFIVMVKTAYQLSEKICEDDIYVAEPATNPGIRFTNDNDVAHTFFNSAFPQDQYSVLRIILTPIAGNTDKVNVGLEINGVPQTNSVAVQTYFRKYYCASVGTGSSNSAHFGLAEIFHTNGLLAASDAKTVTAELIKEYGIGQPLSLPYATNVSIAKTNGNYVLSFKANDPLNNGIDPNGTIIQWIDWQGQGPAGSVYRTDLKGATVPATFSGSVQVTVKDLKGNYFSIPAMAATPN